MHYSVSARRLNAHGREARTKQARLAIDTDLAGRPDAFNPAELFLASIAACILKGIERVVPLLDFEFEGAEVHLEDVRQDSPPKMVSVTHKILVKTGESDQRLELLHKNVRICGTISNTVAEAANLSGTLERMPG